MTKYIIGIDLGTTNNALAAIDVQRSSRVGNPSITPFSAPQLVAAGQLAPRPLLPSFLYLPAGHDLPPGAISLPWDQTRGYAVGEFARNHGARVPGRLVSSAKSWLCHAGVDRTAALLPWSAPPDLQRISPVEASTRYLRHLAEAWNYTHKQAEQPLEKQPVVLTVPASFDDVARNLTVEAARKAGFENLTLLEEPQAAFYCWIVAHAQTEARGLKPGSLCLVIDVGGGTSDFSLIRTGEQQGELTFLREAVGDHLLLGGDNMDLALAKFVETKLPQAGKLDAAQYGMLTQACRQAKEVLLDDAPPASVPVTVVGRGSRVMGGTLSTTIAPADVHRILFDGFFPQVPRDAEPARGARTGLHEMGLPYVSDAGITKHLAAFLKRHLKPDEAPAAILFNGGVFQPASLRERVISVMRTWYGEAWKPLVLTNPSLDLAVAWGAAYFGWLKHTGGRRIGGGIARSYYVGVADGSAQGDKTPIKVLCVSPQHLEEGQEVALPKPELELALGQPVTFPLYSSTVRADDKPGDVLEVAPDQLLQLPPLHTILRGGRRSGVKNVPVTLAARSTEIGTLELWCVAKDGDNRWRLEFNVREIVKGDASEAVAEGVTDVWPEEQVQEGAKLICGVFSDSVVSPVPPAELTKALESALGAPRHEWPSGLCRRLWEYLAETAEQRRKSPGHLVRWYNLTGYSLRPGFGDSLDRFRVEQLWKMMHAPPKGGGQRPSEGGADYWVMWRRVAGGLNKAQQQSLFDRIKGSLLPGKSGSRPGANELAEMWRQAASLERLDGKHKEDLGQALLKPLRRSPTPTYGFWALTRLGARVLVYGPLNAVLHPDVAQRWLDDLLPFKPGHESERLGWAFCLAQLARRSGQRAHDVDDAHRDKVLTVLRTLTVPEGWVKMVEDVTEVGGDEQTQMLGESLPIGLRLMRPTEEA